MQDEIGIGPLTERFNLEAFVDSLVDDLKALRANKISVRDAQARANLARQVLRGIHYIVMARQFLEKNAKTIPAIETAESAE